jgi:hypothetical protein
MAQFRRSIALRIEGFLATGFIVLAVSQSPALADTPMDQNAPLFAERKQISELIEEVRQKGTNVSSYQNVQKYIEDSLRSGASPDSVKHTADELISHLNDEKNGVQHPVITVSHDTTSGQQAHNASSHRSGAQEYSAELKQINKQKQGEYKRVQSREFWQKVHDESHHHH